MDGAYDYLDAEAGERARADGAVYAESAQVEAFLRAAPPRRRSGRVQELEAQLAELLPRLRVAVIHGGDKNADGAVLYRTHNVRSWKSYEAVARDIADSLERLGARDVKLMADDMRLGQRLRDEAIDFVWLNTGGVQGRAPCAHAAAILEMLGVPYLGHDPMTAAILDAKHVFKRLMVGAGVPTAEFHTVANPGFAPETDPGFARVFGAYGGPFIVKPVSGRASLNVEYVETRGELAAVVERVFDITKNDVLIERFLGGREYCVAAAGPVIARQGRLERLADPFVFACVERVFDKDERIFTSMDKKPITKERVKLLSPTEDRAVVDGLKSLARRVVQELGIETLVRLDVRADTDGKLYVLETNPKPDLKAPTVSGNLSIIYSGLEGEGMSYDDLIMSLLADRLDLLLSKRRDTICHFLHKFTA